MSCAVLAKRPGVPAERGHRRTRGLHRDREARHAEERAVRGFRICMRNVHWLHALATPTSIVSCGAEQDAAR